MNSPVTQTITGAALLAGCDGDTFECAALQLLIDHGRWLDRPAFTDCCAVSTGAAGEPIASVQWGQVGALLGVVTLDREQRDAIGSPTSWVVLATAHAIATDVFRWRKLDHPNRQFVAKAASTALNEYLGAS